MSLDPAESATYAGMEWEQFLKMTFPEDDTARKRNERKSWHRAFVLTMNNPDCSWLFGVESGPVDVSNVNTQDSLLTELGRISEPDVLLTRALLICELKPKAREGVAMLRRLRLGRKPGCANHLADSLRRVIDQYRLDHEADKHLILDALASVAESYF